MDKFITIKNPAFCLNCGVEFDLEIDNPVIPFASGYKGFVLPVSPFKFFILSSPCYFSTKIS